MLRAEAFDKLQSIIDNPPEPSQGLVDLMSNKRYERRYEQDDGVLSDKQVAEIRKLSTATDIPESDFDQKLI